MTNEPARREEASELTLLLRQAKTGEAAAFEQILLLHDRRVFLIAYRLLGSVEDAQDASQEVFLRLHKHLRRFDDSRSFGPWLYRVTLNVCRDLARRRRPEVRLESVELNEPASQPEQYSRGEQLRIVRLALGKLPHKERAALLLRDIEGLATGEVARILGSSEATVRSQVSSARVKVKRFVDRLLGRAK